MLKRLALASAALFILPATAGLIALPGRHGKAQTPPTPPPAASGGVYAGCNVPSTPSGSIWYIDANNGKTQAAGGDGSQAHPWNSLKAVVGTTINGIWGPDTGYAHPLLTSVPGSVGPIHPGDTIMLMSGNYGDIGIGNFNTEITNSDWVTVQPVPGQTPVLDTLNISRTNKWVFKGIKVQSLLGTNGNTGQLVGVGDQGAAYPTADIVLQNLDISSADHLSTTGWSQATWKANARNGIEAFGSPGDGTNGVPYSTCVSITGSKIHDVYNGVGVFANSMLVSNNEISYFTADGIDYGASGLLIANNYEHDAFTNGDGIHQDGAQGQNGPIAAGVAYNAFSNILIDSNLIIRQTDPALQFGASLQGIDAFDEDWTNVTVTNNVIVASSCNGISFGSIHNSLIANNTVVDDGQIVLPGCAPNIAIVANTHQGPASTNTRMTNNTAAAMALSTTDTSNVADHNVIQRVSQPNSGAPIFWIVNGAYQFIGTPGTYSNGASVDNVIDSTGPAGEFTTYSPSTFTYNLTPLAGSPLTTNGSQVGATQTAKDIVGVARSSPFAVGAYAPAGNTFALPTGDVLHYISPTGSDSANGLTAATAWATPHHAMNCGDVIIAATGNYSILNSWGAVSNCPSTSGGIDGTGGIYAAVVLCAGPLTTCAIPATTGQSAVINASNWALEGFQGSQSSPTTGGDCFTLGPTSPTTSGNSQHHDMFINDIVTNCGGDGFNSYPNGSTGTSSVDQSAVVGVIAYAASQSSCTSGVSMIPTTGPDHSGGTHVFVGAAFSYHNVNKPGCSGTGTTSDGEGVIYDSWGLQSYVYQGAIEQSAAWGNGGPGFEVFPNGGTDASNVYMTQVTSYGNNQDPEHYANNIGEIYLNGVHVGSSSIKSITNSLVQATVATPGNASSANCSSSNLGCPVYAYSIGGSPTTAADAIQTGDYFKAIGATCANGSNCDSNGGTDNAIWWDGNNAVSAVANTLGSAPGFANPSGLPSSAPNCSGYASVTDCMNTGYSVAADLAVSGGAAGKGYQPPGACAADTLYPTWLKGLVYLQWNSGASTITENPGLLTKPCGS